MQHEFGHFTHVFVDEAGQAMEPECMIPMLSIVLGGKNTRVVLSGDPMQLGPVIRSPSAKLSNVKSPVRNPPSLMMSMLERLMTYFPVYARDTVAHQNVGNYDARFVTKLVHNYRSHESILEPPSKLFYERELIPSAPIELVTSFCDWEFLPAKGFPIIFHGLRGRDERENNSPSWFNAAEAFQVATYAVDLLENKRQRITQQDIGIITPYRKQVEKIRVCLNKTNYSDVRVATVEEFQGQEKRVIIISTVRSSEKMFATDLKHHLGFLKNPKRFNVAITRAQALMIIVGNPYVLAQDEHWSKLLQYIISSGGYRGNTPPPNLGTIGVNELQRASGRLDQVELDVNVEAPWVGNDRT